MAAYTQLHDSDIREIAALYDLQVIDYEPIATGAENSNYVLQTPEGSYILTISEDKTYAQTVELGRLLLMLKERAFPTTHPMSAVNGEIVMMHNGKPVMMKEYVPGQVYQDLDSSMLNQVGVTMAKLHQVPWPEFLTNKKTYGARKFSSIQGKNDDSDYEAWIAERLPSLEQQKPGDLPQGLIHGDIFYDNVIFEGARLKVIIDFEEVLYDDQAFDLGMSIVGLCTNGLELAIEKARPLVAGYEQIRRLREDEKRVLQLFVEYAAATVSCWRYWKYHFDAPRSEMADKHREMMRLAEEVRAIPKERFFEAVFD